MNGRELFEIWAPEGGLWSAWARAVPFIALSSAPPEGIAILRDTQIFYADELSRDCAVIVDLPEYGAITEGLALSRLGYRPVPLFNGCNAQPGAAAIVDNQDIEAALRLGADSLKKLNLPLDAPPVFLLDTERVRRFRPDISVFDNSWDIYYQDFPTAGFFLKNGIRNIVVQSQKIEKDLSAILYRFQKGGLTIRFTNGYEKIKDVIVKKPRKGQ